MTYIYIHVDIAVSMIFYRHSEVNGQSVQRESPILHNMVFFVGKLCLKFDSEPHMAHVFQSVNGQVRTCQD